MKRIVLVLILAFFSIFNSHSQTSKGAYLLGGSARLSFDTDGEYNLSMFPDMGYFTGENFCIGTSTPLIFYKNKYSNSYYVGISPFLRYYFGENDRNRFYGLGRVNFKISEKVTVGSYGWVDIGIGHVWFINNSIGLETEMIGNLLPDKITLGAYLGFQIYFNNK
jgi:hypothetical protein